MATLGTPSTVSPSTGAIPQMKYNISLPTAGTSVVIAKTGPVGFNSSSGTSNYGFVG